MELPASEDALRAGFLLVGAATSLAVVVFSVRAVVEILKRRRRGPGDGPADGADE